MGRSKLQENRQGLVKLRSRARGAALTAGKNDPILSNTEKLPCQQSDALGGYLLQVEEKRQSLSSTGLKPSHKYHYRKLYIHVAEASKG